MSLANKFKLKTAVEEIKEDLITDTPSVVEEDLEQVPDHTEEMEYMKK